MLRYCLLCFFICCGAFCCAPPGPEPGGYGTNAEYIYTLPNTPQKEVHKGKIYDVVSICRYPMNTNPINRSKVDEMSSGFSSSGSLWTNELGVITKQIKTICSNATIFCIPKSMYQLFILKAYCDDLDLAMNDHNDKPLEKWMENLFGYPAIDRTIPLQAYCVEYIARPAVQGLFWEINDRIEIFLKENNVDVSKPLTQADLQKMATILWGKLCMKTQNYYRDRGRKIFAGNKSMTYYYDRYVELIPSACTIKSEHISAVIKVMLAELGTMKDPKSAGAHRLYRGANRGRISSGIVGDSSETTGDIGAPYSFSDGVFGGLLGDWKNGMAWALAVGKNGSLFYLDVQKSENVSSTSVYIPPLFCFGRTVINGMAAEYHHPRIKAFLPKNNYDCCWLLTSPVVEFKLEQLRKLELKKFCEEDREYSPKEFYTFHKGKLLSWNAHNLQEFPQEFSHLPRLTIGLQDYKMEWWRKLMDVLPGGDSTGFILDHYWEMMPWKFGSAGKQAYPSENPEYFTGDLKALENTMNAAVEMNIF